MRRFVAFAAFAVLAPFGWGQTSPSSSVSIDLPKDAKINLEIDAQDDDLLAVIRQFFGTSNPAGNQAGKSSISFPVAGRQINIQDVSAMLKNIHRLHAISYSSSANSEESMAFHEAGLTREGFRRMVYSPDMGLIIMRRAGQGGMGFVYCHGQEVTVARTDGMIDMNLLGKFAQDVFRVMVLSNSPSTAATPAIAVTPETVKVRKRIVVSPTKPITKAPAKRSGG